MEGRLPIKLEADGLLAPGEDTRDIRVRFRTMEGGLGATMQGKHFWQFNPYFLGNDTENGYKKFLTGQRFIPREPSAKWHKNSGRGPRRKPRRTMSLSIRRCWNLCPGFDHA